ncbi:metal-sulfur cluster assembly factor [uncultured Corynebacterium sp.]|uniref:metal-sulfur cluster assembly factor n=1 Tax=uncultured Corynebacterium sp. TaxID=159447 RepID=UPI002627A46D|nr:metal-sulfur cluster assembly factor [uncultured Corynebacterium sp.]
MTTDNHDTTDGATPEATSAAENAANQAPSNAPVADVPAEQGEDTAAAATSANGSSDSLEGPAQKPPQSEEDFELAADVEEYLRDVIDPELGINVVDLGLVYDIWIEDGTKAVVNMTLTSPACPLTDMIEEQAAAAVMTHDLVEKLTINWVWMPPWGPQMITEEGREQLRALGFSV